MEVDASPRQRAAKERDTMLQVMFDPYADLVAITERHQATKNTGRVRLRYAWKPESIAAYRHGWQVAAAGGMLCDCATSDEAAGWQAWRDSVNAESEHYIDRTLYEGLAALINDVVKAVHDADVEVTKRVDAYHEAVEYAGAIGAGTGNLERQIWGKPQASRDADAAMQAAGVRNA